MFNLRNGHRSTLWLSYISMNYSKENQSVFFFSIKEVVFLSIVFWKYIKMIFFLFFKNLFLILANQKHLNNIKKLKKMLKKYN